MIRAAILIAMIVATSASAICDVVNPLLPSGLPCTCVASASGVGGSTTCTLSTPAMPIVGSIAVPVVTFSMGAEVLPCVSPASASIHASVTLPSAATTLVTPLIGTTGMEGLTLTNNVLTIEKSVESGGGAATFDIPFYTDGVVLKASVRIALSVSGTIEGLTVSQNVDMCITEMNTGTEICGASLPKCDCCATFGCNSCGDAVATTLCVAGLYQINYFELAGSPPYDFMTLPAVSFNDACAAAGAAGGGGDGIGFKAILGIIVGVAVVVGLAVAVYKMNQKKAGTMQNV